MSVCGFIKASGDRCRAQAMRESQWCYYTTPTIKSSAGVTTVRAASVEVEDARLPSSQDCRRASRSWPSRCARVRQTRTSGPSPGSS